MKASAAFAATADRGRTRIGSLVSAPPVTLRSTPDALYLVGSGAGPVGGDELSLDASVGEGASVVVRGAAATLVHPGPTGAPSSMTVRADVRGRLDWRPEPMVLIAGCDHRASTFLSLAPDARLHWTDEVVLGRHDEPSGSLLQRLHVDLGGRPLLRNELAVGPRWPGSHGPASLDGAGAVGALLGVGVEVPAVPEVDGARAAIAELAPAAWLLTVVADEARNLRRVLDGARDAARHAHPTGHGR